MPLGVKKLFLVVWIRVCASRYQVILPMYYGIGDTLVIISRSVLSIAFIRAVDQKSDNG
jgi:hypothetical protein